MRRLLRVASVSLVSALVLTMGAPAMAAQVPRRTPLTGSVPGWVSKAHRKGAMPKGQRLQLDVYLRGRDGSAAEALARAVSDPSSPSHGRYLTAAQYRARFAPSQADVSAMQAWLRSQGFRVLATPANHRLVRVEGTVAQAETAFATKLDTYAVRGRTLHAPAVLPSVPSSLGQVIRGVGGLASNPMRHGPLKADAPPPPAFVNAPPCSRYWAEKIAADKPPAYGRHQPWAPCGYVPRQLQGAYGIKDAIAKGLDGRGQTVAITDAFAAPTIRQDANTYARRHGQAPFRPGQFRQIVPPGIFDAPADDPCDPQGWYGEETLDVEAVHGMAPGAKVLYVGATSCEDADLLDALNTIVDGQLAQIVTNSWGGVGEDVPAEIQAAYTETFVQAAIEGIGMFFSSGDAGDEIADTGLRQVDFPANNPWITAVGGTSLAVGKSDNYLFETGWGTTTSTLENGAWTPAPPGDFLYGAGGGTSRVYPQPSYQAGVVPPSISRYFGGPPMRAVPDIAADGDPNTGMLIGETQTFPDGTVRYSEYRIGGTSLSSPLIAGIEALVDQLHGRPTGFANPAIYRAARSRAYHAAFHDVVDPPRTLAVVRNNFNNGVDPADGVTTVLRTLNQTGTLHTRPGYDDVTGVGTPKGPAYLLLG
jgi:subtilase family serine protease